MGSGKKILFHFFLILSPICSFAQEKNTALNCTGWL